MNLNQSFSYTGSSEFKLPNIGIPSNGIALFDSRTGIGGVDYMPADGDTVTVIAGFDTDPKTNARQFDPDMNNNIYYLVTDVDYGANDKDTILSLATVVAVTYNIPLARWEGTFTFSNPDDLPNLYLIWDYTDNLDLGLITYGGKNTERIVNIDYSANRGIAGIDYSTLTRPVRFQLQWNNVIVGDSGYVGLNSLANYNALIAAGVDPDDINLSFPYNSLVNNGTGQLRFNKFSTLAEAYLLISAPRDTNSLGATRVDPVLTDFFIDPTNGDITNICAQVPSAKYFHDGSGALPTIGGRIYTVSSGATLFNGGNAYHQINISGSSIGLYVAIDENGVVYAEGSCICGEVAVPVIGQVDLALVRNQAVNVQFEATNNPTSWSVTSTCDEYLLFGGTTGTVFNMTDCTYGVQDVTVSINESRVVCSSSLPTVVGGDGTVTLNGPCLSSILPNGLSFDLNTGILSGTVVDTCEFSMELTATNCFGTSAPETVNITVMADNKFKPFLIDIENFGVDGASACLVSPLYSVLYHNGAGDIPVVGDYIYRDAFSTQPLMGGDMWYKVYSSLDSLEVSNFGKVCDAHTC
jgi:hypothetical protein